MNLTVSRLSALLPLLFFASCSGTKGFVSSLDDLAADVNVSGALDLEQARAVSLNGLIPSVRPGGMVRYASGRSPFTAIGISELNFDGGEADDTQSYIVRREVKMDGPGLQEGVKTLMTATPSLTSEKARSQTEIGMLIRLRDKLLDVRLLASELIRASAAVTTARLAASLEGTDKEATKLALDSALEARETKRGEFNTSYNSAIEELKVPGVMVIRVATQGKSSSSGGLGELFGFSRDTSFESTGFAILGGLQYEMLFAGRDIEDKTAAANVGWHLVGEDFPYLLGFYHLPGWWLRIPTIGQIDYDDVWVVTSALKAKHILYAQDSVTQERIEANLAASFSGIGNIKSAVLAAERIEIEAVFSAMSSLGNTGVVGSAMESVEPLEKVNRRLKDMANNDQAEQVYQTVYQISSDLADLLKILRKGDWKASVGLMGFLRDAVN